MRLCVDCVDTASFFVCDSQTNESLWVPAFAGSTYSNRCFPQAFFGVGPKQTRGYSLLQSSAILKHRWQGQKGTIARLISQNSSWERRLDVHGEASTTTYIIIVITCYYYYYRLYNTKHNSSFDAWQRLFSRIHPAYPCITLNPARDETQSRPSIVQRCVEGHRLSSASWRKEFLFLHSVAKRTEIDIFWAGQGDHFRSP